MKGILYYSWIAWLYILFTIKKIMSLFTHEVLPSKTALEKYSIVIHEQFFNSFNEEISNKMNENIDAIFYDKKEFSEIIKNTNDYENKWKRNFIFICTPREDGKLINIVMYYDVYKSGFAYYCDESSVSYNVLNNMAMKYVMTFHCRDFFVDEKLFLEKECEPSPLIEKVEYKKKENKNMIKRVHEKVSKDYIHSKNKFIYLGKIGNFSCFKTNHCSKNIMNNTCTNNLNYKDYKNKYFN